jgi:hypothetical protein
MLSTGNSVQDGMVVRHKCDNPSCGNPDHLIVGTQQENVADRVSRCREGYRKGIKNGRAKLSEYHVIQIRARFSSGKISKSELSKEYGVTDVLIGLIIRKRIWSHV